MYYPHCGKPLQITTLDPDRAAYPPAPWLFGLEYRSKVELLGLPLLHVAIGFNPGTGLPRLARGVIAIGNFALGVVAIGGMAAGGFVISGIGVGLGVIAGIAVGWTAVGGIALGASFALGCLDLSFGSTVGGLPLILNVIKVGIPGD